MKEIKLTRGLIALVDDEDYDYLNQFKWNANKSRDTKSFYATRYPGIKMHRVIMNTPDNLEVDHIDHNGLNNQRCNLRNCTRSQNHMNKNPKGDSKYLGVSWDKSKNKWRTFIQTRQTSDHRRKTLYSGTFLTENEAAVAYNNKAKEFFGEFANLNKVQ
jgi:hypothetical protein